MCPTLSDDEQANDIVSAKALNLLAAVVEWGRDIAPVPKNEKSKRVWNNKFLAANLARLNPESPEKALKLFQIALDSRRFANVVALIGYHPAHTFLKEKIGEWQKLDVENVVIEHFSDWEISGHPRDSEHNARCEVSVLMTPSDGPQITFDTRLFATRSAELPGAGLPSVWQIELSILGAIQHQLRKALEHP